MQRIVRPAPVFRVVGVMLVVVSAGAISPLSAVDELSLTPFSCCDGAFVSTSIDGQTVWRNVTGSAYLYFKVPSTFTFTRGKPVYVEIVYYDGGAGTIWVQYDSDHGDALPDFYFRSETHTRSSRIDSGEFVTSYHQLLAPRLAGRQNGSADFRVQLSGPSTPPLAVHAVTIRNSPFDNPEFQYVLTKPWSGPYAGPSRDDVDRSTLAHKVMVGYQGWFRTPNDLADRGWTHWCRDGEMVPENFTVDMWPDLSCFRAHELFRAGEVLTQSGAPAHVFSSTTRETVRRHFRWMRQYNIDGAFLQRFATEGSSGAYGHDEWVLHHVREAANLEGRTWAIEYDVSALDDSRAYEVFTTDWRWLVDTVGIREDPRYAYEGGEPVVFIWGLPFPSRGISRETADAIVDFFQSDPQYGNNYVIGGIPWWWRSMPDWFDHIQLYDGALAWMPPSQTSYTDDRTTVEGWGSDYFAHVWPGFSWANLQKLTGTTQYTPRNGGAFYWEKIRQALSSGSQRLFVGMFDEYDEGTAIMPMSDDPPNPPPAWGRFLTNEGKPADWYMLLTAEARAMLLGQQPVGVPLPTEIELQNRSNIGPEASVDFGSEDEEVYLSRIQVDDGDTAAETFAGRECRAPTSPDEDLYFYLDVHEDVASEVSAGLDVTVELEYNDEPGGVLISLEYDGLADAYTLHPKTIRTQGSGEWRTVRFEVADALFAGRQNGGADLRVRLAEGGTVHIDRVRVVRGIEDCNSTSTPDACDIADGTSRDCDDDWIPDECDLQVIDATPPEIDCPGPLVLEANLPCGYEGEISEPSVTDQCDGHESITLSHDGPATFPTGTTVLTWTAVDIAGNSSVCAQDVIVVDVTAPEISCPGSFVVDCVGPDLAFVTFEGTATDDCDESPQVTCSPRSGSAFAAGTTRVTCTARDASGNTTTCFFDVVVDCTPRGRQIPGDCTQDGELDVSDGVCVLGHLYLGEPERLPCGDGGPDHPANLSFLDWQPDLELDISDGVALLQFLYVGGPPHPLAVPGNELQGCVPIPECPDRAACP